MFGLGFIETIFFILVAAILFLKPEDYPKIAKSIAKVIRQINLFWHNTLNQIDLYDDQDKQN